MCEGIGMKGLAGYLILKNKLLDIFSVIKGRTKPEATLMISFIYTQNNLVSLIFNFLISTLRFKASLIIQST